jgi:hypothetical protein
MLQHPRARHRPDTRRRDAYKRGIIVRPTENPIFAAATAARKNPRKARVTGRHGLACRKKCSTPLQKRKFVQVKIL